MSDSKTRTSLRTAKIDKIKRNISFLRRKDEAIPPDSLSNRLEKANLKEKIFALEMKLNKMTHIHNSNEESGAPFDFFYLTKNNNNSSGYNKECLLELKSRPKPFGDLREYSVEYSKYNKFLLERKAVDGFKKFIVVYEFCNNGKYEYYATRICPNKNYKIGYKTSIHDGITRKKILVPLEEWTLLKNEECLMKHQFILLLE